MGHTDQPTYNTERTPKEQESQEVGNPGCHPGGSFHLDPPPLTLCTLHCSYTNEPPPTFTWQNSTYSTRTHCHAVLPDPISCDKFLLSWSTWHFYFYYSTYHSLPCIIVGYECIYLQKLLKERACDLFSCSPSPWQRTFRRCCVRVYWIECVFLPVRVTGWAKSSKRRDYFI